MEDTTVDSNTSTGEGGGLYLTGDYTVSNSILSFNAAAQKGGALRSLSTSTALLTASEFRANGANQGGGMFVAGPTAVSDTTFLLNEGTSNAPALLTLSNVDCINCTFADNIGVTGATVRLGPGLSVLDGSRFESNSSPGGFLSVTDGAVAACVGCVLGSGPTANIPSTVVYFDGVGVSYQTWEAPISDWVCSTPSGCVEN